MRVWKWSSITAGVIAIVFLLIGSGAQEAKEKADTDSKTAVIQESGANQEKKGDFTKGKELFQTHCVVCHDAGSEKVRIGPGLKGLFKKPPHEHTSGKKHAHNVASVREQIKKGSGEMPAMESALSEKDIDDLIAYLQTL